MGRPPLTALQGFVLAARMGNLSLAARYMHLTTSALSHQIRGLEDRLGQRVFVRGPRGVDLTPEGARLLELVGPQFESIERALQEFSAPPADQLTISVMPSVASSWLVPRLHRFVAAHQHLQLNVQSCVDLVNFERESVDAALRFGPGEWPGVCAEHLFDDWLTPIASPELIKRLGRPTQKQLADWPLLRDPENVWAKWFDTFGGTPPKRYLAHFDNTETLHHAAVEGMGIALGRVTMAQPLVKSGQLVLLSRRRLRSDYAHYLVYPPRSAQHPALLAFRAWLLDEAQHYAQEPVRMPRPVDARRHH
ncbi:LysR substrate-binding domain-containing protein [Rhodanobacter sp. MP7CTX1]|uniref:LysR substrate-binding domain-containing protein n=1 Tax=Rhodanobacter sp. MP7CTX1 TaxID=2723084 RepID=UPI00161857E2|nr:LysR substrate-binding domain-containing protein [Rhodanobacter sp. MP7CTX1]MBB6186994.1 LysR family glycine cleavage system transcriptional activator [Rhodanobacter sp. MP7CTX1]